MEASAPPRPVEPRPPAARCGLLSYPGCPNPVSKPPNRIETTRKVDHTPISTKHLKSVVLRYGGCRHPILQGGSAYIAVLCRLKAPGQMRGTGSYVANKPRVRMPRAQQGGRQNSNSPQF